MRKATKNVLILGSGSIGSEIARELHRAGHDVHISSQSALQLENIKKDLGQDAGGIVETYVSDVLDLGSVKQLHENLQTSEQIDALVYAVGSCPPGGFMDEISTPLHELSAEKWESSIGVYVTGFLNSCRIFLPEMKHGSHIVALSSAITHLTPETCPPWLHAWHYIAIKAALDKIIMGYRHNPLVRRKNIKVHRIAPAAVDTAFHTYESHQHYQPAALVPVSMVVDEVIKAMESDDVIDIDLVPGRSSHCERDQRTCNAGVKMPASDNQQLSGAEKP